MKTDKRDQLRRTLCNLAAAHAATIELMEQTLALLGEDLALDATTFWNTRMRRTNAATPQLNPEVDERVFR